MTRVNGMGGEKGEGKKRNQKEGIHVLFSIPTTGVKPQLPIRSQTERTVQAEWKKEGNFQEQPVGAHSKTQAVFDGAALIP